MVQLPNEKWLRQHLLELCCIFFIGIVAFLLRTYRLSTLTTFGRDQGIDFLAVRQMIIDGKPTLLGIKVSLAEFHQGPIYLYLLVPFFYLFHFHPIAGAYAAISIAVCTLIALYFTVRKFFGRLTAVLSSLMFAVSPEFIREGNTPLYQHVVPLFVILALYFLLDLDKKKQKRNQLISTAILGILVGVACELHFLAVTFALAVFLYLLFKYRTQLIVLPPFIVGLVIGMSPTLAFELRHSFLNTKLFIQYIQETHSSAPLNRTTRFIAPWIEANMKWFGAEQQFIGVFVLGVFVAAIVHIFFLSKKSRSLWLITVLTSSIAILFSLKVDQFLAHYLLPTLTLQLVLVPAWITQFTTQKKRFATVIFLLVLMVNLKSITNSFSINHGYSMPNGWSLAKIEQTASIISDDVTGQSRVNVASLLDGDTRAYPLRYSLITRGTNFDTEEQYPMSNTLYVVSSKTAEETQQSPEWEITSLQPSQLNDSWDLNDGIYLYKFSRIPETSDQMF